MSAMRFQFEIDEEWLQKLEELMKLGGLRTKKELMNNALTVLDWAVKQRLARRVVLSVAEDDDGTERELEMPYLNAVAAAAKKHIPSKAVA
jgi:Uncharacterized protein conserved in bacteria (DUF2191).